MAGYSNWAVIRRRRGAQAGRHGGKPVRAEGSERVRYEGYGPGGAAIVIECVTNDRARTATEIRGVFAKYGGYVGADGAVSYLFNTVGLMTYPSGTDEKLLMKAALEAGAEDVVINADHSIEVLADPIEFETVHVL